MRSGKAELRIAIHDYGGYAFIVDLSRALARRGHHVLHLFASRNPTPHGLLETQPDDPPTLELRGVATRAPLEKYSFLKRWSQEREYGGRLASNVAAWGPEIVISANTPVDSQSRLFTACRYQDIPFVFWVQDLISDAMRRILTERFSLAGSWLGMAYQRREMQMLKDSSAVVAISPAFAERLARMGIPPSGVHVVPNWAPLGEIPVLAKDNPWSKAKDLNSTFNFLYSGSLGLKHDPSILVDLAQALERDDHARVVVVSEGLGASWLAREIERLGLKRMTLLPFEAMERFPEVLASADVLLALLESDAGDYSVPSKVLSYLCAGRPMLLAMPEGNLAARSVLQSGAGLVVPPGDSQAFVQAALSLQNDPSGRKAMGQAGRAFAESRFDMGAIADRFEAILHEAMSEGLKHNG